MTVREPAGPTAIRKEAARAMRVLEEDVFETLEPPRSRAGSASPWRPLRRQTADRGGRARGQAFSATPP